MAERIVEQENKGLMEGKVVIVDGKYCLQACASKAPAESCMLYKNGFCGTVTEGVNLNRHPLHCGKISKKSVEIKQD